MHMSFIELFNCLTLVRNDHPIGEARGISFRARSYLTFQRLVSMHMLHSIFVSTAGAAPFSSCVCVAPRIDLNYLSNRARFGLRSDRGGTAGALLRRPPRPWPPHRKTDRESPRRSGSLVGAERHRRVDQSDKSREPRLKPMIRCADIKIPAAEVEASLTWIFAFGNLPLFRATIPCFKRESSRSSLRKRPARQLRPSRI
ncbi:hypothetical protein ABIB99_004852 [Bradyrhizobium sp. LA6.1]